MWQTKYAVPKNLGLVVNFWPAVKAISSLGVLSPWHNQKAYEYLHTKAISMT